MRLHTFQRTRVLEPNRMNRDRTYMRIFIIDAVVTGGKYDIRRLLERMPSVDQAAAEYRAILRIACVGEGGRAAVLDDAAAVAADSADQEPTGR
jgi:hypothetical protein